MILRLKIPSFYIALLAVPLFYNSSAAQPVAPEVKSIEERDCGRNCDDPPKSFKSQHCRWIYEQFLDECLGLKKCTPINSTTEEFSMSTVRGMSALETVITVRVHDQIYQACFQTCAVKRKPSYKSFRRMICSPQF